MLMLRASTDRQSGAPQAAETTHDHTTILEEFVDAVVGDDPERADDARALVVERLGSDWLVDTAAVIANFEMMTRLADATGARLRPEQIEAAASIIDDLGLGEFPSART